MLEAVIFDFDGVISDSEPIHYEAFSETLKPYNFHLSSELYYKDYVGYCDSECFEAVIKDYPDELSQYSVEELVRVKTEHFAKIANEKANIFNGVAEFIDILESNNIPIAICSGATLCDIKIMLAGFDLINKFQIIVSDDDVTKGKPDPEGYLLALEKLNIKNGTSIKAENCIVIEDSRWGLQAAIAAKMKTIAVTNSYLADELKIADKIVDNLKDISFDDLQKICS